MSPKLRIFFEFRVPIISYLLIFITIFVLFLFNVEYKSLHIKTSQIGILLLLCGFGIRVLASLTTKYFGKIKITGIYAICRHPMLLGQMISVIGLNCIVCNQYFFIVSMIIFICNDFMATMKYDKILAHHYRDIWKIYSSQTRFILPFTNRIQDVMKLNISSAELNNSKNFLIFIIIYMILIEIATFSNM